MLKAIDHLSVGIKRLTSAYKDKPNINKLLTILLEEINELESAMLQVKGAHEINNANGQSLEYLGRNVGAYKEPGQTNEQYRKSIYTKIGQNISKGEPETIKAIYKLLTNGDRTQYSESKTGVTVYTDGDFDNQDITTLFKNIKSVVMGGKRVELLGKIHSGEGFSFAGNVAGAGFDVGKMAYSKNINLSFRFIGTSEGAGFKVAGDVYSGGTLA